MSRENAGYVVETKDEKIGRTYHEKEKINGKVQVFIEGEETPLLCDPTGLKIKGFID